MAIDLKYGKVTLEKGTIGEDEPVFVLRAQDNLASKVLAVYLRFCEETECPTGHLAGVIASIQTFENWALEHYTQFPKSAKPENT